MDNINSNMIGNLFSSLVVEKFSLDSRYSVLITTMVSSLLISFNPSIFYSLPNYIYYTIATGLISYLCYMFYPRRNDNSKHTYIRTYRSSDISQIRFMMDKHPEFFKKEYNMVIGDPEADSLINHTLPDTDECIDFHDKIHDVKGTISLEYSEYNENRGEKSANKKAYYVTISIEKNGPYNCSQYLNKLQEYKKACLDKADNISLYMTKVMSMNNSDRENYNHEVLMYSGPANNHEERYTKYMHSYFSKNRDRLWTYISNVHFHPEKFSIFGQEARCNLLIHGPPGSGKSSFVYRLAMSLGRHIVSVDIASLSDKRTDVYRVIQTPYIDEIDEYLKPDQFIVLLEEFDMTIKHLENKSKRKDKTIVLPNKPESKDSDDFLSKLSDISSSREFELGDLLEILQGPVPIKGSIIIATTNKFEEIKEKCPALFRPGRLTPVEFGYMTWKDLNNMTEFYFKKSLDIEEMEINIPTSEIIELALECSLYETSFEKFQENLKAKLK